MTGLAGLPERLVGFRFPTGHLSRSCSEQDVVDAALVLRRSVLAAATPTAHLATC